jgi:hypothetical protein
MIRSTTAVFPGVPVGPSPLLPDGDYVPQISLTNFSSQDVNVHVQDSQTSGGTPSVQDLGTSLVPGRSSRVLKFRNLQGDPGLKNSFLVSSDGAPGDLISKLVAASEARLQEVELLGKDQNDPENGGNHPWSLEQGNESTLLLFNHGAKAITFFVFISGASTLWQKTYRLAPLQTEAISFRSLIEEGTADDSGKTISKKTRSGQVGWIAAAPVSGKGRLLQSNRHIAMARSFSCPSSYALCAAQFVPNTTTLLVGHTVNFGSVLIAMCDNSLQPQGFPCGGETAYAQCPQCTYSWTSGSPSIVSIDGPSDGTNVAARGVAGGSGTINVNVLDHTFACQFIGSGTASVRVPRSLTLSLGTKVTYNGNNMIECDGITNDGPRWGYSRCAIFTLKDQNGLTITTGSFTASEVVSKIASNPGTLPVHTGGGNLTNGTFQDFWSFVAGASPPPQPGEFVKSRQRLTIKDNTTGTLYPDIRINCLDFESTDVTATDITISGTCQ